ncbi:hypothetical protein CDLVIII_1321 [Clostridium sp. DL-VIII]|uniref:hypothetical protein n=1 Tax=Clostridium sp. DL-VIII TaxID=641107 RepID=UPI00023AF7B8|nr:hypothetical protein [Clostridium sp. DL-VIII]EHI98020.1 hypothetical protein CDLVIII_1321 [Clostridium sp. DL-VIII]
MGLKYLLVKVKEDSNDEFKEYRGLELMAAKIDEDRELLIVRPIELDQMERFYKASYDSGMKDMISNDYEYCVWYLADEECELQCSINVEELDIIRELTEEDFKEHEKNFEEFKKIHKFKERQQKMEDDEKEDKKCEDEFNSQDKVNFRIKTRTREGYTEVEGIIYKGFGIEKSWNTITILSGESKGLKLCSCPPREIKKIIDEIKETIGNEDIKEENKEAVISIIRKWRG